MTLDASQLTLPQIAAAVAAGELRLADAEAELRKRPAGVPGRWNNTPPPAPAPRPLAAQVLHALDETRRELRQATRKLTQLSDRIDSLTQLAATLQPAPVPPQQAMRVPAPAMSRQRRRELEASRTRGMPMPLEEPADNDNDLMLQLVTSGVGH